MGNPRSLHHVIRYRCTKGDVPPLCKSLVGTPDLLLEDKRARDPPSNATLVSENSHLELPYSTATSSCPAVDVRTAGGGTRCPEQYCCSVVRPLTMPVSDAMETSRGAPKTPRPSPCSSYDSIPPRDTQPRTTIMNITPFHSLPLVAVRFTDFVDRMHAHPFPSSQFTGSASSEYRSTP